MLRHKMLAKSISAFTFCLGGIGLESNLSLRKLLDKNAIQGKRIHKQKYRGSVLK